MVFYIQNTVFADLKNQVTEDLLQGQKFCFYLLKVTCKSNVMLYRGKFKARMSDYRRERIKLLFIHFSVLDTRNRTKARRIDVLGFKWRGSVFKLGRRHTTPASED